MRVLCVDLMPGLEEAQRCLVNACASLPSAGVEVVAGVPYGPLFNSLSSAGVPVFPVSPARAAKRGWGVLPSADSLRCTPSTVFQIMRVIKPDIVHANGLQSFAASQHAFCPVPLVWHVRDRHLPIKAAREASRMASRIFVSSEEIDEYLVEILSPRLLGRIRVIRDDEPRLMAPVPQSGVPRSDHAGAIRNRGAARPVCEQLAREYRALLAATDPRHDADE